MAQAPQKFSKSIKHIDPKEIIIEGERQRSGGKEIDTSDIEPSIKARGIFNPIIVRESEAGPILVAGERRLLAAGRVGLKSVPIRYFTDLDPIEVQLVELEENERRKDLPWRDRVICV